MPVKNKMFNTYSPKSNILGIFIYKTLLLISMNTHQYRIGGSLA